MEAEYSDESSIVHGRELGPGGQTGGQIRGAEEVGGAPWSSLYVSSQTLKSLLC